MNAVVTVDPNQLAPLSEIPADLHAVVFSPAGPLQSVPFEKLLTKLIATNLAKPSKAALDADLAHPADSVALVFSDPAILLNGWYRKTGAAGAGDWQQFEELSRNARNVALSAAAAAELARDNAQTARSAAVKARDDAEAAKNEALAAAANLAAESAASVVLTTATDGSVFASRALLATLANPVNGQSAIVSEEGASGTFVFSTSDLSAQVAIDSTRGIYVAPAATPTGASGAWVRRTTGRWKTSWFLTTPGAFTTPAILQKIENLRPDGQDVKFNVPGTYNLGNVIIQKGGHWGGTGRNTVMQHFDPTATIVNGFTVATSNGLRISHMAFSGFTAPSEADARAPIHINTRVQFGLTAPKEMEDIELDHLWFEADSDIGIRSGYGGFGPSNDIPGTTWWTPRRIHIHHCVFDDVLFNPISAQGNDVHIERCFFKLSLKPVGGYRARSYSIRIHGCDRLTVNRCTFDVPADFQVLSVALSGVDNGPDNVAFRNARNVKIHDNWFHGGVIICQEQADLLSIKSNWFWNDPTRTDGKPPVLFTLGGGRVPVYFGSIVIEDNEAAGFPDFVSIENGAFNRISIKRNIVFGNRATLGAFGAQPVKIQINNGLLLQDGSAQVPAPVFVAVEENEFFVNPSGCGSAVNMIGNMTGMHLRYSGNKVPERAINYNHITHASPAGTTPKVSLSRASEFVDWTTIETTTQAAVVGDNVSMPSGFYASLMASSKFRPEQVVGVFPPVFA